MEAVGATTIAAFADPGGIDSYVDSLDRNPRYRNDSQPHSVRKTGHPIGVLECAACDLCVGVCPNAAIFTIPPHRIAIFDDWCNDCGNCETFCPDVGAPNRIKPRLSSDGSTWSRYEDLRAAVLDPSVVNSINCLSLEER
jgi:ferredoxin